MASHTTDRYPRQGGEPSSSHGADPSGPGFVIDFSADSSQSMLPPSAGGGSLVSREEEALRPVGEAPPPLGGEGVPALLCTGWSEGDGAVISGSSCPIRPLSLRGLPSSVRGATISSAAAPPPEVEYAAPFPPLAPPIIAEMLCLGECLCEEGANEAEVWAFRFAFAPPAVVQSLRLLLLGDADGLTADFDLLLRSTQLKMALPVASEPKMRML